MVTQQRQQVVQQREIGLVHHRVVEHDATAVTGQRVGDSGTQHVATGARCAMFAPVHRHRNLGDGGPLKRLCGDIAGQRVEAKIPQHLCGVGGTAIPRRREDAVGERAEGGGQGFVTRLDALPLGGIVAARAELALAPLPLVIDVGMAVLVNTDATRARPAHALQQRIGKHRRQCRRNDGEVDRHRMPRKQVKQGE